MLLQNFLNENLIKCNIKSTDKIGAISELVDLILEEKIIDNKKKFLNVIEKREKIESTGIGNGVALPHGRDNCVKKLSIAVGRSLNGIDFFSLDNAPVYLIFLVASPLEARKEYLQVVAKIARLLRSSIMRESLMKAETSAAVMKIIKEFDEMVIEHIKVKTKKGRVIYGGEQ